MADTPLGKGLIEIGANLAPLEAGLAQAQAKTRAALGGASVGVGGTATGAGAAAATSAVSNTKSIIEETAALNNAAQAQTNYAQKAKQASDVKAGLADRIKGSTKGFRDFAGAITSTVGAFTGLLGVGMMVVGWITNMIEKEKQLKAELLEISKKTDGFRESIKATNEELRKFDIGQMFSGYGSDKLGSELDAVNKYFENAKKQVKDLRDAEEEAFRKREDVSEGDEELDEFQRSLDDRYRDDFESLEQRHQQEVSSANERAVQRNEENIAKIKHEARMKEAKLAGDEKLQAELQHQEQVRQLQSQVDKGQINTFEFEERKKMADIDRQIALKAIADRKAAELKAANDVKEQKRKDAEEVARAQAEAQERAAKQFAEAQREQFAGLQNQINSLFNTGSMEVGINRVAGLVQVLIDKTERR